jgi:iron complex outermembrane receptor protein
MHTTLRLGALVGALVWPILPAAVLAQQASEERAGDAPQAGDAADDEGRQAGQPEPDLKSVVAPPPGIEAIEVTGESLDTTNVQDEAQAITAFDSGELDRLQIGNVDRLAINVPGLHVGQQGQNAIITLRGVGTENASITGEPGVAFHVDEIYYGSPAAARTAFFDIQAIEVKRGPQGFLGGKNSTSGAIMVKTNDPTADYEAQGDYTIGNYDRQRLRGHVNIPLLGETLSARLAVFYEERDGYLERQRVLPNWSGARIPDYVRPEDQQVVDLGESEDPFDLDNFGLRGKLRFQPKESLDFVLGYNYFKEGGNGPQADIVPLTPRACIRPPGNIPIPPGYTTQMGLVGGCRTVNRVPPPGQDFAFYPTRLDVDPRKTYTDFGSTQDDTYWGWSGRGQWDTPEIPGLGATTVKLLGGFQETELGFNWDFDGSDQEFFNLLVDTTVQEYTSELQWSGGDRLTWQASLFYQRQHGESRLLSPGLEQVPDPNVTTYPDLTSVDAYVHTVNFDTEQWTKNKSYGAALHGAYSLTDNITFSLGGRWNKDHKRTYLAQRRNLDGLIYEACAPKADRSNYVGRVGPVTEVTPTGFAEPLPHSCGETFRGTMWGSRLEWKPTDDYLLYAGIDRGYKAGGFASGGIGTYRPEKIWAYTLGTKTEFFDQRLQLNLEGFVYNYQDMQIALLDATKLRTENTDARMYGWEVEMRASPIDGLRLQGLVAYLHTETIDYFSLDPAHLGDPVQRNRVTTRDAAERRGFVYPDGPNAGRGGDICQPFPRRFCQQLGDRNGLDDYSGNQLSRSPELKWNISAEYDVPLGRWGTLTPGVQHSWQDDAYYRVFNTDFDLQEAYHETNLRMLWTSPEEKWEVEAYLNNLQDNAVKQNILIGPSTFGSIPLAWYGEPRFYGMRIAFKY